jgi:hypothetical protein
MCTPRTSLKTLTMHSIPHSVVTASSPSDCCYPVDNNAKNWLDIYHEWGEKRNAYKLLMGEPAG